MHDATTVTREEQGVVVPNQHYPHHDPKTNSAPHGWLNGPNGATVVGNWLYAVGKDNHLLVRYDLREIRKDDGAGAPESEPVFGDVLNIRRGDELVPLSVYGHSAVVAHEGHLYVGFRTSSVVVRIPLDLSLIHI